MDSTVVGCTNIAWQIFLWPKLRLGFPLLINLNKKIIEIHVLISTLIVSALSYYYAISLILPSIILFL